MKERVCKLFEVFQHEFVSSSSADVTRVLRGCFREGSVPSKQRKTSNAVRVIFFDILITRKGASALGIFKYI